MDRRQSHTSLPDAIAALATRDAEEHAPNPSHREIYDRAYGRKRYRDVYFALKPIFDRR